MSTRKQLSVSLVCVAMLAGIVACNQATVVAILQTATDSALAVIAITNPTYDTAILRSDIQVALDAVKAWKPGQSNSQNVIQVLDIVAADIGMVPIPQQYQAVIVIAINGVKSVIVIIDAANPPPVSTGPSAKGKRQQLSVPTYTSAAQFKASFNAAIAEHPELAAAKQK